MLIDILIDQCLLFLFLSLFDLAQVLLLVSQHVFFKVDMIFPQQFHQLPPIRFDVLRILLEEDEFAVYDGGLIVDLVVDLSGLFVSFRLIGGGESLFFVFAEASIGFGVDVTAAGMLSRELESEPPHYLVLLVLISEQLISQGVFGYLVLIIFFHGRRIRYKLYIMKSIYQVKKRFNNHQPEMNKLFIALKYILICTMHCKLYATYLILILLFVVTTLAHVAAQQDDDIDADPSLQLPSLQLSSEETSWSGYSTHEIDATIISQEPEEIQKEIDQLIGIHEQKTDFEGQVIHPANLTNLKRVLENNKQWAENKLQIDPQYFKRHHLTQKPTYLWIGCSDSRLPANEILGLDYGEVFVLRNVANTVSPSDISALAVIQYAVEVLQVKDIIVAGHYGCGGVKAAVKKLNHGPLEAWLSKLRRIRHKHAHAFANLHTTEEKARLLVEINVKEQVFNVASTPFVQKAWKQGQELRVHGVVFDMKTGHLIDLHLTMHSLDQLPEELVVFE